MKKEIRNFFAAIALNVVIALFGVRLFGAPSFPPIFQEKPCPPLIETLFPRKELSRIFRHVLYPVELKSPMSQKMKEAMCSPSDRMPSACSYFLTCEDCWWENECENRALVFNVRSLTASSPLDVLKKRLHMSELDLFRHSCKQDSACHWLELGQGALWNERTQEGSLYCGSNRIDVSLEALSISPVFDMKPETLAKDTLKTILLLAKNNKMCGLQNASKTSQEAPVQDAPVAQVSPASTATPDSHLKVLKLEFFDGPKSVALDKLPTANESQTCDQQKRFTKKVLHFIATGEHLRQAQVTVASSRGFEISNLDASSDTRITGDLTIEPNVEQKTYDFNVYRGGEAQKLEITTQISGTQYLVFQVAPKLPFQTQFVGNWNEIPYGPNASITELGLTIGEQRAHLPAYKKLGLTFRGYTAKCWSDFTKQNGLDAGIKTKSKCHTGVGRVVGLARPWDEYVNLLVEASNTTEAQSISATALHEAAHKLHYSHLGLYKASVESALDAAILQAEQARYTYSPQIIDKVLAPFLKKDFQVQWNAVQQTSKTCPTYLPPIDAFTWKNGGCTKAKCGYVRPYGAMQSPFSIEDVATFVEALGFDSALITEAENSDSKAFAQKKDILKNFGFIP